jgi:alpha-beta hydrolase superfamily lysophospholipase
LLLPVLLIHGTGDRLTSHEASKEFAVNNNKISLKLVKDGYHELHNDLCKKDIMLSIVQWIELMLKKKRKS